MTSRERIIAVLERQEPDRVPTFEWKVSQPIIDAFVFGGDVFDFTEAADQDAVVVKDGRMSPAAYESGLVLPGRSA